MPTNSPTLTSSGARAIAAYVATRTLAERTCGLCHAELTSVRFAAGTHRVEVLSCGPCGWHTRQIDGVDATMEDLGDVLRGANMRQPATSGRLPGTWDRR